MTRTLTAILRDIEEMVDDRADVDDGIPNHDMKILVLVREALQLVATRIDKASGSPTFTSAEHDKLQAIIAAAGEQQ